MTYTLHQEGLHDLDITNGKTKCSDTAIASKTVLQTKMTDHQTQTELTDVYLKTTDVKLIQTDEDKKTVELNSRLNKLLSDYKQKDKLLEEVNMLSNRQAQNLLYLNTENNELKNKLQNISIIIDEKDKIIKNLELSVDSSNKEINSLKLKEINVNDTINVENQALLLNLKKIESDKNDIIMEYKELLKKERQDYLKSIKKLQSKLLDLQSVVDE